MRTKFISFIMFLFISTTAFADLSVYEAASLKPGDVVVSINGKTMKNNLAAIKALNEMKKNSHVVMEVLRDGKIQQIKVDVK